jgi:hypothetical protein
MTSTRTGALGYTAAFVTTTRTFWPLLRTPPPRLSPTAGGRTPSRPPTGSAQPAPTCTPPSSGTPWPQESPNAGTLNAVEAATAKEIIGRDLASRGGA